jgi:hypothetical protein
MATKEKAADVSEWAIGQPLSFPAKEKEAPLDVSRRQKKQSAKRKRVRHRSNARRA